MVPRGTETARSAQLCEVWPETVIGRVGEPRLFAGVANVRGFLSCARVHISEVSPLCGSVDCVNFFEIWRSLESEAPLIGGDGLTGSGSAYYALVSQIYGGVFLIPGDTFLILQTQIT